MSPSFHRAAGRPGGQGPGPGPHYNLTGQSQAPHFLLFLCRGGCAQESEFKQFLPDPLKEATLAESSAVYLSEEHCASGTECRLTDAVCGCAAGHSPPGSQP